MVTEGLAAVPTMPKSQGSRDLSSKPLLFSLDLWPLSLLRFPHDVITLFPASGLALASFFSWGLTS